jgi:hypothetical protein
VPAGFFHLTVLLTIAVTLPLHMRLAVDLALADLIAFPAAALIVLEAVRRAAVADRVRVLYRSNRMVFWYFGWAGAAAVVGLTRSADSLKAFKDLIPPMVLYTLVGLTVSNPRRLHVVIWAALPGLLCHIALAASQALIGAPYVTAVSESLEWKMDIGGEFLENFPVGLFAHPNGLALFLIPRTLFLVALLGSASARARFSILALLLVDGWVLWQAQVKGAYAFIAMGFLLLFVPRTWERRRFILSLVLPVLSIAMILWFTVFTEGAAYGTLITRMELWVGGVQLVAADGFTQMFGNGYPLFGDYNFSMLDYPNAHNAWLNQILSFGIPGLALYLASFATALRILARKIVGLENPLRAIASAAVASLAALLGESFFEPSDRGEVFPSQVFLLFALAVVIPAVATVASVSAPRTRSPGESSLPSGPKASAPIGN